MTGGSSLLARSAVLAALLLLVQLGAGFLSACGSDETTTGRELGSLTGRVTVGPIHPGPGPPPGPLRAQEEAEGLAAFVRHRKVIVYDRDTRRIVATAAIKSDGAYSILLPAGKYIVDVSDAKGSPLPLEGPRFIRANVVRPKQVDLAPGSHATADFDIDTGMR
jgi:hypothetical protein